MSAKNFKFVSPGIVIKEIDKSILSIPPGAMGPLVIGRSAKGPCGTPIQIRSYAEFVEVFGEPIPGVVNEDVFRNGNTLGPTYASYAAKAWLRNNSPLTFIRLLGEEHPSANADGKAGWGGGTTSGIAKLMGASSQHTVTAGENDKNNGGAYALWLFDGTQQLENQGLGAAQATGTISVDAAMNLAANRDTALDGDKFTLIDAKGISQEFEFDKESDTVTDGTIGVDSDYDTYTVALSIKTAINNISGLGITAGTITAAGDANSVHTIALTQALGGESGNTVIDMSGVTGISSNSDQDFSGGTNNNDASPATGSLAAVFYCNASTTMALSGTFNFDQAGGQTTDGMHSAQLTASQAATIGTSSAGTLTMLIGSYDALESGSAGTNGVEGDHPTTTKIDFNLNRSSDSFIRKVFNTNPTLTNTVITATESKGYFLGESYEGWIEDKIGGWSGVTHGLLMGLKSRNNAKDGANHRFGRKNAYTGWYISQDTGDKSNYDNTSTQKLFRFVSLDQGEWTQNNVKISIQDIKFPTNKFNKFATFTIAVRDISDKDSNPQFLEMFAGLNLNPSSPDYIKRRLGDKYYKWNSTESRYREYGEYPNRSKYIRVEMDEGIDLAGGEGLAPFGVYGPYRFLNALNVTGACQSNTSGSQETFTVNGGNTGNLTDYHMIVGDTQVPLGTTTQIFTSSLNPTGSKGFRGHS